jgi:hypothetical protein
MHGRALSYGDVILRGPARRLTVQPSSFGRPMTTRCRRSAAAIWLAFAVRLDRSMDSGGRDEHLEWCKERAREYLDAGELSNAVASMV